MIVRPKISRWDEPFAPKPAYIRQRLFTDGFDVQQWGGHEGGIIARHKFHRHRIYWVVQGEMEFSVDGIGDFVLGAGDRSLVPAETYHSARFISEETVLYLIGDKDTL